jgi:ATP-dependent DNA helicase RecG
VDDADVKVTATSQLASMYIRKQNIFTEKRIFPYVSIDDLRLDLLPRIRKLATNNIEGIHGWESMNDEELLRSAGLYGTDRATGEKGYNLAGVMLLGKDDVIRDICPAYETDALVRKINIDRYDDRETVRTNLIESYDQLMDFARKHLPDKFFLEGTERKNLRNIITREVIGNTLIHREFTSAYTAKFVIEKNKMYTENASRSAGDGIIKPENMEPNPKNPIIASFFRNIGWSDRLGSGVRNLFKYAKYYSGQEPEFIEGDVFRIIVPLDEEYSYDSLNKKANGSNGVNKLDQLDHSDQSNQIEENLEERLIKLLAEKPDIKTKEITELLGWSSSQVKYYMKKLKDDNKVIRHGTNRNGYWEIV